MGVQQSKKEELWNAGSHAVGIVLGVVALVVLLLNDTTDSALSRLSIVFYAVSVIVLFTASTVYHAVSNPALKARLRKFDHISIYYLIAGTYTPMSLITLKEGSGWVIFYTVWGIALLGTLYKLFYTGKLKKISLVLYLGMGWLIIFYINEVIATMPQQGLWLLMGGGAFYTLGTIFYAMKKMKYHHVVWHFFVLGGATCHFFMILLAVV